MPATAIQANGAGVLCAWVVEGTGYRAVTVTVAGSRAGVTNVATGLLPSDQVLANPATGLMHPRRVARPRAPK